MACGESSLGTSLGPGTFMGDPEEVLDSKLQSGPDLTFTAIRGVNQLLETCSLSALFVSLPPSLPPIPPLPHFLLILLSLLLLL